MNKQNRREFIQSLTLWGAASGLGLDIVSSAPLPFADSLPSKSKMFFKISLGEWSCHRAIRSGQLEHLDFPAKARKDFGIDAVEYLNLFFKDKGR